MRSDGAEGPDPAVLVGLLAEDDRLRVAAALALGADDAAAVAAATGLPPRTVTAALERLVAGGLVERAKHGGLRLRAEAFKQAARAAAASRPDDAVSHPGGSEEANAVLRAFVRGGRLVQIPTSRTKRRHVLDFLASQFEPGRVYPEREVNEQLRRWHDDSATLRRYLVDEEFLERRDGFYWRTGGTFDVD